MSYSITIDTSQVQTMFNGLNNATEDMTEGMLAAVNETLVPDLAMLSSSIWNVETGQYSEGWVAAGMGNSMVQVTNTATSLSDGYPYAVSLEYGWTSRGSSHAGGFVAQQAVDGAAESIQGALMDWITSQT